MGGSLAIRLTEQYAGAGPRSFGNRFIGTILVNPALATERKDAPLLPIAQRFIPAFPGIANDIAKYFAIIPAMFVPIFPGLARLDVMRLHSPESAMLSAVIFNALIIVALIPLSLRGVRYRALNATALLRRNLLIYGLGGVVAPFVGIKLIDLLVGLLPGLK